MDESEIQIPSYFLCPISLQLMRDPVTLATGITYDRQSIEHWLFSPPTHNTCPATKQPLCDSDLTPNHTLRRLIQSWCSSHSSLGIPRFPTPRPPVDKSQIASLLHEPTLSSLTKLKNIASESERNKRCVEATPGAIDFLASFISAPPSDTSDEAVCVLHTLQLSQQSLRDLLDRNPDFFALLTGILGRSADYQSRAHAVLLIKALLAVAPPERLITMKQEFFEEVVKVLRDRISYQAMKAALQVLYEVCSWGRNTAKAVRAGAARLLVELLVDEHEKKACEMMMVVLEELCGCPEGREEVIGHAAGLAVVCKKMVRVSAVTTERAVRILYSIALNHGGTAAVVEEMLEMGAVSKLCLLLQADCAESTRRIAREILSLHINAWRRSPCLTPRIRDLYPPCKKNS